MSDERTIEARIYERLSKVIDPELGRSVTDLGMIAAIDATPVAGETNTYDVRVRVELTVEGCPLSQTITNQINGAVASYPDATLIPSIEVGSMSQDKLTQLVAGLKAERKQNPFNKPGIKTRIFAIASGKGGVGKSSVTANLAATFAALGYDTAAIDADIYGFSLPRLFGVQSQPTNLNGMLMPVTAWGVKLISIGMFAGADRASYGVVQDCNAPWNNSYPTYGGASRTYCCSTCARHRRHGDFRGAGTAERRTGGGHHTAAIRLRHRGTIRPGGIAGADESSRRRGKHELLRAQRREATHLRRRWRRTRIRTADPQPRL